MKKFILILIILMTLILLMIFFYNTISFRYSRFKTLTPEEKNWPIDWNDLMRSDNKGVK